MTDVSGQQASNSSIRFFFSTPVWGEGHLGLFLSVGLPSLLSSGNLPGITNIKNCRYFVYTRQEDEPVLRASEAFKLLGHIIEIELIVISEIIASPHRTMSDCHMDTMRRADEGDAAAVFLPPDCVWSDGSLVRLEAIAASGKSVVHMSGVRTDRDAILPKLLPAVSDSGRRLTIDARTLVRIGLEHLHPAAYLHFWNEHNDRAPGLMPANLYWTVPDQGLLLRCFHLHPLMVKSQVRFAKFASTIDDDLPMFACPDSTRDYVVTDSDEILAFEMSGLERDIGTVCDKGSVSGAAAWAEVGVNARHQELGRATIRMHHTPIDENRWREPERAAGKVIEDIIALNTRGTLRLAFENPEVFTGRVYAISLGHRPSSPFEARLARLAVLARRILLGGPRKIRNLLFYSGVDPLPTHPEWHLRNAALRRFSADFARDASRIVFLETDEGMGERAKAAVPGEVRVFPADAVPHAHLLTSTMGGASDAAVEVDLRGLADAEPVGLPLPAEVVKRRAWYRPAGAEIFAVKGVELRPFGGKGTKLAVWLNNRCRAMLTGGVPEFSLIMLPWLCLRMAILPVLYLLAAATGLAMNALAGALDMAQKNDDKPGSS